MALLRVPLPKLTHSKNNDFVESAKLENRAGTIVKVQKSMFFLATDELSWAWPRGRFLRDVPRQTHVFQENDKDISEKKEVWKLAFLQDVLNGSFSLISRAQNSTHFGPKLDPK